MNRIRFLRVEAAMNLLTLPRAALGVAVLALSSCVGYGPGGYAGGFGYSGGYDDSYGYGPAPILAPRSSNVSPAFFNSTPGWNRPVAFNRGLQGVRSSPAYCPPASSHRSIGHPAIGSVPVFANHRHSHSSSPALSSPLRTPGFAFGGSRPSSGSSSGFSRGSSGGSSRHGGSSVMSMPPPAPRAATPSGGGMRSAGSLGSSRSVPPSMPSIRQRQGSSSGSGSGSHRGGAAAGYPMVRADGSSDAARSPGGPGPMDRLRRGSDR
jgi:hypothetical protein